MGQSRRAARETMAGIVGDDLTEAKAEGPEAYQANIKKLTDNLGEHTVPLVEAAFLKMSPEERKQFLAALDAMDAAENANPPPATPPA